MKYLAKLIVGMSLLCLSGGAAATLLTVVPHPDDVDTGSTLVLPNGAAWSTPAPAILSGHIGGVSRSPFDGSGASPDYGDANNISHWSIGTHALNNTSMSWLNFDADQSSLKLVWGSPDSYNYLEFYNDDTLVAAFTGTDVIVAGGQRAVSLAWVTISDLVFDQVKFISTRNAFEFSNIMATPVPAPASLPLLLTLLLLVSRSRVGR
ncbi:MAG: hypothetical protein AAF541_10685 [Pseudomonadota bacterium]